MGEELKTAALHTLANLADDPELRRLIVEKGGLDPVISNLESSQVVVLRGASAAVANLAEEHLNHPEMLQRGTIEKLVVLARRCKNDEVQYRVACALNALAGNQDLRGELKDRGAPDGLKALVRSRDPETKAVAIEALAKLGIHAKSKAEKERLEREKAEQEARERAEREAREAEARRKEEERLRLERERAEREAREAEARRRAEEEERRRREEEERRRREEEERRRMEEEERRRREEEERRR